MSILDQIAHGQAPPLVPLSVEQYHEMIARGILREGDSIELIDGFLIRKDRSDKGGNPMSHGPRHASGVKRLLRAFRQVEQHGYHLHSQLSITLGTNQEPEPDLAIVRGAEADYDDHLPSSKDIVVAIEVSSSSLTFDRTTKQRLYAAAKIPSFWIVNVEDGQIEAFSSPDPDRNSYASRTVYHAGQTVKLSLDKGVEIDVEIAELLPK